MRVGLIGFGKTGKAVASVILQNKEFCLEWVLRESTLLNHRSVPEFLGIESDEPGLMYSTATIQTEELLDKHPVDFIIDFSASSTIFKRIIKRYNCVLVTKSYQTVRLIHESISREAFGNGAIFIAKNRINKQKGFYKFEDILSQYMNIA